MNTDDYEIFKTAIYKPFYNNGKKWLLNENPYLDIVLGDHCNAKCKFCIGHLVHKRKTADFEQQKPKIDFAIKSMGVKEVLLLGGEPTIYRPTLTNYARYLKDNYTELNKICITTNGFLLKDKKYLNQIVKSGITHINISLMATDTGKQTQINGTKTSLGYYDLENIYSAANENGVKIRIQANVWKGNLDNVRDIFDYYFYVKEVCDSVKFSPLLKTDSFSTVNEVTEWNKEHMLTAEAYDELWHNIENTYATYPIVRNKSTFGFVEYSMICHKVPIILNYNHRGKLKEMVVEQGRINNIKLLSTGDLSLSWNREEKDLFINTEE